MAPRTALGPALLAAAALLGAAAPAGARAPTVSEQGGLDWVLDRLQADRAEDQKGPRLDPDEAKCLAYQKGETALDQWLPVAEVLRNTKAATRLRQVAFRALLDRVKAEEQKPMEEQRPADSAALRKTKKEICLHLLPLVTEDDGVSTLSAHQMIAYFFPTNGVDWRPGDPLDKRKKARQDLHKILTKIR